MGNYIYYDYKYKQMPELAIQGQARQKDVTYLYCNKYSAMFVNNVI